MYRTTAGLGDEAVAVDLRSRRQFVKGRFHGGTVGYVCADELSLYAAAYRRSMIRLDARQEAVIRALTYAGPLSPRQLRAETSLAHRPLMAAVHRLERAFVVCEDQTDDAWNRPLHFVEREFPDLWQQAPTPEVAMVEVLARLLDVQVFATTAQLAADSGLGKRVVTSTVDAMARVKRVEAATMEGEPAGWRLTRDETSGDDGATSGSGIVRV